MQRHQWEFKYLALDVLRAAESEMHYHEAREEHWATERLVAEDSLREEGIEMIHHEVTGGTQVNVQLDPEKAKWLNTCQQKLREHHQKVTEFSAWVHILGGRTEELSLHHDDVLFFWPDRAEPVSGDSPA
jgi:hypothetical protein